MENASSRHFRLALVLGAAGAAAVPLVFPYVFAVMPEIARQVEKAPIPLPAILAAQLAQSLVLFTLMAWAGLAVGHRMGLDAPMLRRWVYRLPAIAFGGRMWLRAAAFGVASGVAILLANAAIEPLMPTAKVPLPDGIARWKGFLASFYGGIGEELQLRLFVMTLLTWLAWKALARASAVPPPGAYWIAIVLAAFIFGAGHLPAAASIWPLDGVVVFRTILLNMIAGIPCGWLFWRHGLESAMAAHFAADMVLHVIMAR